MKKIILVSVFFASFFNPLFAQTDEQVTSLLQKIFEYSDEQNFKAASKLFIYEGPDSSRHMRDSYNLKNSDEMKEVSRICKKIKAFMDLSDAYEFGDFKTLNENGLQLYTKEVRFKSNEQSLSTIFYFLKSEKGLMLFKFH